MYGIECGQSQGRVTIGDDGLTVNSELSDE